MNERGLRVLEQYDLKIAGTRRGRGSFICETDKGIKLITEFYGSVNRLRFQNLVLDRLREQGYELVDRTVENMEGELVTRDRDETVYIVKDWFEGRECDTKSEGDILAAVRNLAKLHRLMCLQPREGETFYQGESLKEEYAARNREIKKAWNFMRGRRRKNPFESCFLNNYSLFFEQAREAERALAASGYDRMYEEALRQGLVCHGDYNQHQVLNTKKGMATTNFTKCRVDVQAGDLYRFLRKILEKQDWDVRLGSRMVEEYHKILPLGKAEREYLRIRLAYPEKFWKLANHYYNHNKAWLPGKNIEKLETLICQQEKRDAFLKILDL